MKAALALLVIYVGTFLVAIQGGPPNAVQAAPQGAGKVLSATAAPAIDPAKDADIRALLELVGARDQVQDSVHITAEQYREKLLATVPNNEKEKAFVNTVITSYEKNFDLDQVTEQLVAIYDKHYTDEEIKGLLQFYGSALGQKVAGEGPRISREIQEVTRAAATKAVKDALQEAKLEDPATGQNARIVSTPQRRWQQQHRQQQESPQQAAQKQPQP